jgi:hypothetical protein
VFVAHPDRRGDKRNQPGHHEERSSAVASTPPPSTSSGPRPLWIPPGLKFDALAPALQGAIKDIVDPAYDELVLQAQTALERSSGLTYVHLLWLELVEQIDLGKDMSQTLPLGEGTGAHQEKMLRHMRLISQKDKVAKFLLEVQRYYERIGEIDPLRRLPR